MKDEENFEINSHTGCLRTRWYFRGQGKGFHEIKKRGLQKERGNWTYFIH